MHLYSLISIKYSPFILKALEKIFPCLDGQLNIYLLMQYIITNIKYSKYLYILFRLYLF